MLHTYTTYITSGVDSSEDSEGGEEEEVEDVPCNEGGVATLMAALHAMTLHYPVCHPDRASKVHTLSISV